MIELYQFEMSSYAEKVRLILDYKGLDYKKVEVTPGVGQIEIFQLSGQRQVPVIKDEGTVVADSTAIAEYLDRRYPEKLIIPTQSQQRGVCRVMEQWADQVFGINARKGLIASLAQSSAFRTALLPNATPDLVKNLVTSLPSLDFLGNLGAPVGLSPDQIKAELRQNLSWLCDILSEQPYLVGNEPTLADFAVAGVSLYIKIPTGNYLNVSESLKGQGVPGVADNPLFDVFWTWRDKLYSDFRKVTVPDTFTASNGGASRPTSINID
ncbi:glutathione S-transferase [Alkalinema pantanalense CENA528]|uniref:glutathione S-transferase family protein n=1 Tax=Alkalinema pantanalense TaxID=1620705 RepID=UPI003D6F808A